jgi:branched-subunit amino acid aminotransferase/4-amino-4-deoxychorismate lyase
MFKNIPSTKKVKEALFNTLEANGMWDQTHVRLTLTRGEKITSGMNPSLNQSGCTLIVLAEWKPPVYSNSGIKVITSSIRRNSPHFDDGINFINKPWIIISNLLNNILAIIEANVSGVDSAIMLDNNGFISETNDTNIFIVINGEIHTPTADSCLPGITRNMIIDIAHNEGIRVLERNISISELYSAEEVFTSGTMGEITPILEADGRIIGQGGQGAVTQKMQLLHSEYAFKNGEPVPFQKPE